MLNRTQSPPIIDAVDINIKLKPYEKILLDNQVPVYFVNAGEEEVLMIELLFYAGNCYETKNGVAAATNYLLKNGTSTKTALEINEFFEYHGAFLNRTSSHETAGITLHCLSKHLKILLPVIKEIITDSIFPGDELEIYKQNSKQRLTVNLQKCDFVANRFIDIYLYGKDHPYGKVSNAEDYDALQTQDLNDFYQQYYRNGKYIMFAAGKLPVDFKEEVNKIFGDIAFNNDIAIPQHILLPEENKKFSIVNDPGGVQGAIRIARPFPNRHHPDFKKATILNSLFGGFFGSRLMANIREEKGYTYGIQSYLQNQVQNTAWVISTEAGKDVCEATIKEVYHEMNSLREELVDEEELLLVKNYMMGTNLGDLDGPFHIISRWKNLILNGLDENYFNESVNMIRNITAPELKELANKYLVPEEFFELVVF